jgi:multiple sugar transport system substrate-binding protein
MSSKHSLFQQRMSRRAFLRLAGVGSGAALLAACGNAVAPASAPPPATSASAPTNAPPATSAPVATAAPTTAAEQVTLSFWTPGGSDAFCKGFGTIAENYHKVNPNVTIGPANCYAGQQSFREVLLANIASGTPPDSTIVWESPIAYAVRGALEPLDDLMAHSKYSQVSNWPAGVLASCQFKGKTYGLPATAGSYAIYFNAEMFESKGVSTKPEDFPKTWDDLRKLSKEFTFWRGDTLETMGFFPFTAPGALGGDGAVEIAIWSALNGTQLFDEKNLKYTLDSPENIEMMQYAVDWLNEEYKGDLVKVQTTANWAGYTDSQGRAPMWQEGKFAMLTQGFWFSTDMYATEMKFQNWSAAQHPVGPSGKSTASGYWPNWLVIPKGSKHVQEAFDYLDYMGVEGIQVWFANVPDIPANTLVPADLVPKTLAEKRGADFAKTMTTFFRKQLDVATPMWTSPVQDFGNDQISKALEQILSKTATPKDALGEAQRAAQAELEKALKG